MAKPLGNEDLSDKVGERVIDKPELPPGGITNENDVHTEVVAGEMHLKRGIAGKFEVFSGEPADRLAHLIRNAKAGCFAEGLITQQVPLHSHVEVNGKPFHIEGVTESK